MPGGDKNIKPSDNPKPFTKDYNYRNFMKWTEERCHAILDELVEWLLEEQDVRDSKGNLIETIDKGNCFYKDFLYKKGLYDDWVGYVKKMYTSVKKRMKIIDKIQEHKLQLLAATGKQKESITKFILTNKHNWRERTENENINNNIDIIWNESRKNDFD